MADVTKPKIRVASITEREYIAFGDAHYDIRTPGELSPRQHAFMSEYVQRNNELISRVSSDDCTDEDEREFVRVVNKALAIALDAPDEVRAAIPWGFKLQIIKAFLRLPLSTPEPSEAPTTGTGDDVRDLVNRLTGDASSSDSNAPMAALPPIGSSGFQSH